MLHRVQIAVRRVRGWCSVATIADATSTGLSQSANRGSCSVRPAPTANSVPVPAGKISVTRTPFSRSSPVMGSLGTHLSVLRTGVDGLVRPAAAPCDAGDDDDVAFSGGGPYEAVYAGTKHAQVGPQGSHDR